MGELKGEFMKHEEVTKAIIGCAFEVLNELGSGFLESVYEKAMCVALRQKNISVECQFPIKVYFRGECVGDYFADLQGAAARWGEELPVATHDGELVIAGRRIACAVLDTRKRVLSQQTFLTALAKREAEGRHGQSTTSRWF